MPNSVAYLGFDFGGSNHFVKSGGICMAQSSMKQVEAARLLGGFGTMPPNFFLNGAIW